MSSLVGRRVDRSSQADFGKDDDDDDDDEDNEEDWDDEDRLLLSPKKLRFVELPTEKLNAVLIDRDKRRIDVIMSAIMLIGVFVADFTIIFLLLIPERWDGS